MEYGLQEVNVYVKGPGGGGESAIRSLGALGLRVRGDPQCHAHSPQRLPAAEKAARVRGGRAWVDTWDQPAGCAVRRE